MKLRRRLTHEPLQYILENWHFADLSLLTRKPVFIPRPETPQIVDIIQEILSGKNSSQKRFFEIGIGTGAISILLMKRCGRLLQGKGIDIDQKCVELANINKRKNLNQEQLQNLTFHRQNFLDFSVGSVHEPYDFIVSNPPYVSMEDYLEFD